MGLQGVVLIYTNLKNILPDLSHALHCNVLRMSGHSQVAVIVFPVCRLYLPICDISNNYIRGGAVQVERDIQRRGFIEINLHCCNNCSKLRLYVLPMSQFSASDFCLSILAHPLDIVLNPQRQSPPKVSSFRPSSPCPATVITVLLSTDLS